MSIATDFLRVLIIWSNHPCKMALVYLPTHNLRRYLSLLLHKKVYPENFNDSTVNTPVNILPEILLKRYWNAVVNGNAKWLIYFKFLMICNYNHIM